MLRTIRSVRCVFALAQLNLRNVRNRALKPYFTTGTFSQYRYKKDDSSISSLFPTVPVKPTSDDIDVGTELTGTLNKSDVLKLLNDFYQRKEVKQLLTESGLDNYIQHQVYINFRKYCLEAKTLPTGLHIAINDILHGAGHVTDILPYFLGHAKEMFPHLNCMDDLKNISDLTDPPNLYREARKKKRKIIFHAGPTNSGKTYHALERFMTAKSGVYCGPLKLLATEVYEKCKARGIPCDLVTGEERKYADPTGKPSEHVSCTVEMASINNEYEVAVIDEIQMIKDPTRGWAWTKALLGLLADEIHVCGERGAVDLIKKLCLMCNEDLDVREYKRLTELKVEDSAVGSLKRIQPGDCIVCFSKKDIYNVSTELESLGKEVAVIYGGLPPGTKLAQAAKFNDPDNSCKIMVATDAIGMGLNLSIRRVIFYSLTKPNVNEHGEKEMGTISVSAALQIAGRAGRYGTQWEQGYVTTFKPEDLPTLKELLKQTPEPITQAGIHPTAEQIELYGYYLLNSTLKNLMDIFVKLSKVDDSLYFMCDIEDFKFLAEMIQHIKLPLRARYLFCCAPINKKMIFVCQMFLSFVRQYSRNEPITYDWLCRSIGWPVQMPTRIVDLVHLEEVFDVLDLYLWLSYRFTDSFPDTNRVREMQGELDTIIQKSVVQITRLLKNNGFGGGQEVTVDEDSFDAIGKRFPKTLPKAKVGGGKLTDRLLAEGVLTPDIIQKLQVEWYQSRSNDQSVDDDDKIIAKISKKGTKKVKLEKESKKTRRYKK